MDNLERNESRRLKNNVNSTPFDRTPLDSSEEEMVRPSLAGDGSLHFSTRKRLRSAEMVPVSDSNLLNGNHVEEPAPLAKSLKRFSREELEQIIMGHMVGYMSTYKPYADIEQELDNCKKRIENFQQKNILLTKEVVDLRNIVKSFVTKNASKYNRPIKQLRSVGIQVNPSVNIDDVKLENVERDSSPSTSSSYCASIPVKKREKLREEDVQQQAMSIKSDQTKEDDDLMVMFENSTNFTQSGISLDQHKSIPVVEPIPTKPIVTVTKTTNNYTAALRISWKFPESNHAKIVSCRVFMLIENKNRSVNNDQNWFPIGGDTSRMSCTIPLGRPDKLQNRYQFKVRATGINGQEGPYSDVAHADFP
ncbi:uncharacterized protein LOC124312024 [Daphnia pulicaria]|uniref:uncharacterized protein LOC124312024 n=1 Tax=Daphnia pulicaria TaxID=35523 RepID=UPI001EEB5228|nr:uncharacterized protein LOC124312024 [Daphnia pulicaria]XP_046632373.1 uncharacterized protein LOC124312024 [Daphnia pulicaria]XP_046632374.1 uncharacterized protein LOC124312024 [Daphnia pulicaria]